MLDELMSFKISWRLKFQETKKNQTNMNDKTGQDVFNVNKTNP